MNCGVLHVPPGPRAACHCLLLDCTEGFALIDTGIGLLDIARPIERIGKEAIDAAGFQFRETDTAARQIDRLGIAPADVHHIVLTHGDPDHAGGLADFPNAQVHLSEEELSNIRSGNGRYRAPQFEHKPSWKTYAESAERWFGLEARRIEVGYDNEVLLIPLFGHTLGHCGVAIAEQNRWLLHVGDAYYLRIELETDHHPVSTLSTARADDDSLRRESLQQLRRLARDHAGEIEMMGYHDTAEFPA